MQRRNAQAAPSQDPRAQEDSSAGRLSRRRTLRTRWHPHTHLHALPVQHHIDLREAPREHLVRARLVPDLS